MVSRLTHFLPLLALLAVLGALPSAGHASEVNRIAAVVNDEAISILDLQLRMRLVQATSKLPDTEEIRQRLASQILRKMVEERLMLQEAKRLKLTIAKEDVYKQVETIEKQNRLEPGALERILKQAGVPLSVLYRQLEAELSWGKVIRMTMAPQIKVSEEEVKDHIEMLKGNVGQPEYLLAEILLPVDDADREAEMAQTAQRIVDQVRQGASFQNMARQFSQGAAAGSGGDLDWVPVASLEPEIAETLGKMTPGSLSSPIRAVDGYHIMLLRERRVFGQKSTTSEGVLAITQLFLPAANDRENSTRRIREISAGAKNCAQMEEIAKRHHLTQSGRGTARLSQLNPQARQFLTGLKLLQVSPPVQDQAGVRVIMVCGQVNDDSQTESGLPTEEKVKSALERQRLELQSQRALRDLKRSAFIEIKS